MNKLSLTSKISRNPDVAFTQIDDDLVMMSPTDSLFYGVNAMGSNIWSLLEFNTLALSEICELIQRDYEVTEAQCVEDSMQFVEAMIKQNMLVIS